MKTHKKLNIVSFILYCLGFIWSLLYFWLFAGPTGLLSMIVWQYLLLFILHPAILTAIHIAVKGLTKETLLLPLTFTLLNVINYVLTWNVMWFSQGRGIIKHIDSIGTAIFLTLPSVLIGFALGMAIWFAKRWIQNKKTIQTIKAP